MYAARVPDVTIGLPRPRPVDDRLVSRLEARDEVAAPAVPYALERESYVLPPDAAEDGAIVYLPLAGRVVRLNGSALALLRSAAARGEASLRPYPALCAELLAAGILVPRQPAGSPEYVAPSASAAGGGPVLSSLTLLLTTLCSQRCSYCYARGGDARRTLPWSVAEAALVWATEQARARGRARLRVAFHGGGEVTMVAPLLDRCVRRARELGGTHGVDVRLEAGFNGVMTAQQADWAAASLDGATVSIDGPPAVQDRQRPLADGSPSFERVAATLRRFDAAGFRYGLRMTVTAESVATLPASIDHLCRNFAARHIKAEPVFVGGRALDDGLLPVDGAEFVRRFREARVVAHGHGRELTFSAARARVATTVFCKALGGSIAVTPEGHLSACYEVLESTDPRASLFFVGSVTPGGAIRLDPGRLARLARLGVEHKPACRDCFCRWSCAGDCPAKLAIAGDPCDTSSNPRCDITRALTRDLLVERLAGSARDDR